MEKKNVENTVVENRVATKKATIDFKALAEGVENAFGKIDTVDVIADSNLPKGPKYTTVAEYRLVHFYKPGTDKDMFQLITNSKGATFIVRNKAIEYIDKALTIKPIEKKITVKGEKVQKVIHHEVSCDLQDIADIAKKIISAYQSIPVVEKKKAEPKKKSEPKAEKKATEKKPAAKKNNVAKRPAKKTAPKAVATA